MDSIEDTKPRYFVCNPVFEDFNLPKKMLLDDIDNRFLIKITRIKNIVKELYQINNNLNNPKIQKII